MDEKKKSELTVQDLIDIAQGKAVVENPTLPSMKMVKNRFVGGSQDGKVIEMGDRPEALHVPIMSSLSDSALFFDVEVYELHKAGRRNTYYKCVGQSSMMCELVRGSRTPDGKDMF